MGKSKITVPADPFLNMASAAAYLGMPITTLRRLCAGHKIVYHVIDYGDGHKSHPRFRKSELDAMMERVPTVAEAVAAAIPDKI